MQINELQINTTYRGAIDPVKGLSARRTIFNIDRDANLVSFRNEVGNPPPKCYVSLANASLTEFAAWAESVVPKQ